MPRRPRIILPGELYHVTQRGTRKQTLFADEEDFETYLSGLRKQLERHDVLLHQYCCMTNHVHLFVQPADPTGLSRAIASAHGQFTRFLNKKNGWVGHAWHARFRASLVWANRVVEVACYVARNPVEGGLVSRPEDWPHSSTRDLVGRELNPYVTSRMFRRFGIDWAAEVAVPMAEDELSELRERLHRGEAIGDRAA